MHSFSNSVKISGKVATYPIFDPPYKLLERGQYAKQDTYCDLGFRYIFWADHYN